MIDDIGPKLDISTLESQVEQISHEINSIRTSFEDQLAQVITSVTQLTEKVDSQYTDLNITVQLLHDTISRQNAVITSIQQEFKTNMAALTKVLLPSSQQPIALSASTSPPRRPNDIG